MIQNYSKEILIKLLNESNTYSNFLDKIGSSKSGNSYKFTKKYLNNIGVDYTKLTNKRWSSSEKSIKEVFINGSSFNNKSLKNKILKYNLLEYKCVKCDNIGLWLGKPISLQLDHINGNNTDNRIFNLRFLCPNCHSQTPTFSGKNNKKI